MSLEGLFPQWNPLRELSARFSRLDAYLTLGIGNAVGVLGCSP